MTGARCTVTFAGLDTSVEVEQGTTVRDAAASAGVTIALPCGGLGTCGGCAVTVVGDMLHPTPDELILLARHDIAAGVRLACRARIAGDVTVVLHRLPQSIRVVEQADVGRPKVEPPSARGIDGEGPLLGIAVDVGTTTIVARLIDLCSGDPAGTRSVLNPQHVYGHDVLARISAAGSVGVEALRAPVVAAIQDLSLALLAEVGSGVESLREIAVCGNPTMIHLLLGADPASLGSVPYKPLIEGAVEGVAPEYGFPRLPQARLYALPGISGFIGSDVVADLLATSLDTGEEVRLLIDLGTNGEMVLRATDGVLATSTAAGPALEGATISSGMFAVPGAIERVELTPTGLNLGVIGDGPALGVCGSGLLDLIEALLDAGLLDSTGRLRDDAGHPLATHVRDTDGLRVFEVTPDVSLTQLDVRQVQLAVAAVAAGIGELLEAAGVRSEQVSEVIVAGGFGLHVRARSLVRMGVVPALWSERVRFVGNTALAGTVLALLDSAQRRRAAALALHATTVDLAPRPGFQARFIAAMTFPDA